VLVRPPRRRPSRARLRAALVAGALALAACESDGGGRAVFSSRTPIGRPTSSQSLVVGFVGTLTGPGQWRGEDAFEGADLAVHELNELAGDAGVPFELVVLDDEGDPERATALVEDLTNLERTVGVVYAGPPKALPAAERALAGRGIPALLLYGDLYGARRLSAHVFQVAPSFLWEARRIAAYVVRDRRYATVGALVERSLMGRTATKAIRGALGSFGASAPAVAGYNSGDLDLTPQLRRLRRRHVEALVFEGTARVFAALMETLRDMGASYRTTDRARIATAPKRVRRARRRSGHWAPQVLAFDLAFFPNPQESYPPGTIVASSYARGAHYLPVPSFRRFRSAFAEWWDEGAPVGWEQRAYDATRMIGWAARRAEAEENLARVLEGLRDRRFGGLDVTFGPDDHTAVDQIAVGLWVVPRPSIPVRERHRLPSGLPWVPLSRGFSIDGKRTDIAAKDWRYLVKGAPPPTRPAPKLSRLKFGVTTMRGDPVH
jgi:ABC-type branched-subunit amino acid transport system substrate-binding protein